jgi:hypothetical protein
MIGKLGFQLAVRGYVQEAPWARHHIEGGKYAPDAEYSSFDRVAATRRKGGEVIRDEQLKSRNTFH